MTIVLIAFFLIVFQGFRLKIFNSDYISHPTTTQINGIFVFLVFLSHFRSYFESNISYSSVYYAFQDYLGQLVVATFLFYSGYGVFVSIKKKGEKYISQLPIKILELLTSFILVILVFALIGFIIGKDYNLDRILLSLIGWESIGNSNWYMFDILLLYAITYVAFKLVKKQSYALIILLILSIVSMVFLHTYQNGARWYNTFLCYWEGMCFALYKEKYEIFLFKDKRNYVFITILLLMSFYIVSMYSKNDLVFIIRAIIFVLLINQLSMIFVIKSSILSWLGKHIFGIYLLQRVPMILGQHFGLAQGGASTTTVYFLITFITTLLLASCFQTITNWMAKKIFNPMKAKRSNLSSV